MIPHWSDTLRLRGALRLAHSLDVYHKLDARIVDAQEAARLSASGLLADNNIVAIGGLDSTFMRDTLSLKKTSFHVRSDALYLDNRPLDRTSSALFLHPHPITPGALMLFIFVQDDAGLERALRLFPIRTGVTVPDWIVLGSDADSMGTGGVLAAG